MSLKVVILEDNGDRRVAMQAVLADRLYMYEHVFFDDVEPMLAWLDEHFDQVLFASLDHDLELIRTASGDFRDPGTGRQLSEYLARRRATFPVVLHSSNAVAVAGMSADLTEAGVRFEVVTPYEDTAWVEEAWRPAVRQILFDQATEASAEAATSGAKRPA